MKIKVGDKIRFRSDLKVGLRYDDCVWSASNNRWLGKEATVSSCHKNYFRIKNYEGVGNFFTVEMLDQNYRGNSEIHITTDGTTVHAVMKQGGKVVKHSKAVCGPEDKFDFMVGAKIALERLKEPKFVPHLLYRGWGAKENYGIIGEPVAMTLPFNEPLYVGDLVECYDTDTGYLGKGFVVETEKKSFVMGLKGEFFKNGISREWQIRKVKSHRDLKHGEAYDGVIAILEEESNHEN